MRLIRWSLFGAIILMLVGCDEQKCGVCDGCPSFIGRYVGEIGRVSGECKYGMLFEGGVAVEVRSQEDSEDETVIDILVESEVDGAMKLNLEGSICPSSGAGFPVSVGYSISNTASISDGTSMAAPGAESEKSFELDFALNGEFVTPVDDEETEATEATGRSFSGTISVRCSEEAGTVPERRSAKISFSEVSY